jgi:hypothetical protein
LSLPRAFTLSILYIYCSNVSDSESVPVGNGLTEREPKFANFGVPLSSSTWSLDSVYLVRRRAIGGCEKVETSSKFTLNLSLLPAPALVATRTVVPASRSPERVVAEYVFCGTIAGAASRNITNCVDPSTSNICCRWILSHWRYRVAVGDVNELALLLS